MADPTTVPFVPRQKYIDKNYAPEQMSKDSIIALANQVKIGVAAGVLRKDVASLVLPNIMTENRPLDYGVDSVDMKMLPKGLISTLQLNTTNTTTAVDANGTPKTMLIPSIPADPTPADLDNNAKLAVAALVQKQGTASKKYGPEATAEQVIGLWNGTGPGAANHVSKVKEAASLLNNPLNDTIRNLWNSVINPTSNSSGTQ